MARSTRAALAAGALTGLLACASAGATIVTIDVLGTVTDSVDGTGDFFGNGAGIDTAEDAIVSTQFVIDLALLPSDTDSSPTIVDYQEFGRQWISYSTTINLVSGHSVSTASDDISSPGDLDQLLMRDDSPGPGTFEQLDLLSLDQIGGATSAYQILTIFGQGEIVADLNDVEASLRALETSWPLGFIAAGTLFNAENDAFAFYDIDALTVSFADPIGIPEPTTLLLLATGAVAGWRARGQRRAPGDIS